MFFVFNSLGHIGAQCNNQYILAFEVAVKSFVFNSLDHIGAQSGSQYMWSSKLLKRKGLGVFWEFPGVGLNFVVPYYFGALQRVHS